jgi:hypothetical protein
MIVKYARLGFVASPFGVGVIHGLYYRTRIFRLIFYQTEKEKVLSYGKYFIHLTGNLFNLETV